MLITVEKRFMLVPVSETAVKKKLLFKKDGKITAELDTRLSAQPDYVYPYDMRQLLGETLELETDPCCAFTFTFTDTPDDSCLYREKYRPNAHFTTARGWINDPNGFVYYEGQYHLFYQHNPVDRVWGNMHWGHAVSADLVNWTEKEEALFPDEHGTVYSGSAVIDDKNLTGLKQNSHAPLLLFYTAAGNGGLMSAGAKFTQRLAYSVDGGKTFIKYPRAIIEHIAEANRDPKVVFCEELDCYIMALYLRGSEFALFKSCDLLNWEPMQRLCLEGDNECPDFYPLSCGGERYWVFTAAHDRYLAGRIKNGLFVPESSPGYLSSGMSYAAQTCFYGDNRRRVRFGWNKALIPGMPFNSAMTTPHEMKLKRLNGEVRLCAEPCEEFSLLRGKNSGGKDRLPLTGRANDIELSIPAERQRAITLFGLTLTIEGGMLKCGKYSVPVYPENGRIKLRIIQDVQAIEVYTGEKTLLCEHMSDQLLNCIECEGAEISAWPLKNIWNRS